jgi:hypothetical protein
MTQIERVAMFIRVDIANKKYHNQKPEVNIWEIQEFGVREPNMSSGSAERHARTLRRTEKNPNGILTHPIENGVVNKHAYILAEETAEEQHHISDYHRGVPSKVKTATEIFVKKEVEEYPTIPSHAEELDEKIGCERMDRKIELLKQKSLF